MPSSTGAFAAVVEAIRVLTPEGAVLESLTAVTWRVGVHGGVEGGVRGVLGVNCCSGGVLGVNWCSWAVLGVVVDCGLGVHLRDWVVRLPWRVTGVMRADYGSVGLGEDRRDGSEAKRS